MHEKLRKIVFLTSKIAASHTIFIAILNTSQNNALRSYRPQHLYIIIDFQTVNK